MRDHHQLEEVEAGGGGDPVMESRTVPPLLQMAGDKLIERFVPPRSEHQQPQVTVSHHIDHRD